MRILLINQFFWPDSAATSQLLTDLARSLAARGHEVDVVCGTGRYSDADQCDAPPVSVTRVRTLPFGRNLIVRMLSYASFLGTAAWRGILNERADIVITLTTPPLVSIVGTLLKWMRGSRHYVWEMDVYPDVAIDLGYVDRNGIIARIAGVLADLSRRKSDGVLALGSCMRDRLVRRGISAEKVHVAENWADGRFFHPSPISLDGPLRILYSGNLGLAHDVETFSTAMLALKDDRRFEFIFAGGGSQRKRLEDWCVQNAVPNVSFRSYCGLEDLGRSLSEASVGLVSQKPECLGSVVPSKVYGLMAAGRPILFIGPREATPNVLISRHCCGWHVDCGDHQRLTSLLLMLAANPALARRAGDRAREAFLRNYDRTDGVERICRIIGATETRRPLLPTPAMHHNTFRRRPQRQAAADGQETITPGSISSSA